MDLQKAVDDVAEAEARGDTVTADQILGELRKAVRENKRAAELESACRMVNRATFRLYSHALVRWSDEMQERERQNRERPIAEIVAALDAMQLEAALPLIVQLLDKMVAEQFMPAIERRQLITLLDHVGRGIKLWQQTKPE